MDQANWLDAAAYREDLEATLDSCGDAEIILCTISSAFFPAGQTGRVTSHGIQPLIAEEMAQVIREVANNDGAAAIAQAVYETITAE